tara:strand:- start:101 stop:286 length:186 start_codon:yes stop_codon:yes gene_type:complete
MEYNKHLLVITLIIILLSAGYYFLGENKPRIETRNVTQDEKKEYIPEPCLNEYLEVIECKG